MSGNQFEELDRQVGKEINAKLLAESITEYPVVCWQCHGVGCDGCDGLGIYDLAIANQHTGGRMSGTSGRQTVRVAVAMACERLTDLELAAINNMAQVDWDPQRVSGYEKVKHLFTEANGTRMHGDVKDALASVVLERLARITR